MDLILAVLVLQEVDQLFDPLFRVVHKSSTRVTELFIVWVQEVGCKKSAEVNDSLVI